MKNPKEQAKTILEALKRIDDEALGRELVLVFLAPYKLYTKEAVSEQEAGLADKIIKFLQDVAEGEIIIGEEVELAPDIPDIKSLVDELERAQREGFLEEAQIRKALLQAFLAQKRKEQAPPLPVSPELPITKPPRIVVPIPPKKPAADKKEKVKKEKIMGQLLLQISYKRPSVLELVVQELSKIPGDLPGAVFETRGEIMPVLVVHGVGPEKMRLAIEYFKLQNPRLASNHPVIQSLGETLEALTNYSQQHPWVDKLIKTYQNEIGVDLSLVSESEKDIPSTDSQVFLKAVVRPDKGGVPKLFIVPPTKQALISKDVFGRFFVSFKKLFLVPPSLLARMRGYLGGLLVLTALFLPLPLPVRIIMAGGGFWLGWKQIKSFFGNFIPQILSSLKRVELLRFFSKTAGDILYTIFTKPTLGWLRTALAAGFGAAGFLLPASIPLKILFLGIGGTFGTIQLGSDGGSFLLRGLGAVGRAGVRLSYVLAALPGIPVALILGAILLAVLLPGFLAYQSAQTQALFLPQAGGATSLESRFVGISASATPANIKNEELPKTVEFAIVITSMEQALTLNSVKVTFAAFTKDKTITIPEKTLTIPKTRLAPGESTEARFFFVFDKNFEDSAITATIVVSASVEDQASPQTTSAPTTVIIGSPPTSCFAFFGYWNEAEKNRVAAAIIFVSKSQAFTTKLCAGARTVKLMRGSGASWSGEVDGANGITLFDKAFNAPYQPAHLYYTLAHESGHVYGNYNSAVFSLFLQEVKEPFLATYSRQKNYDEDFAETIGMFIASRQLPSPFTGVNLPALWETYPQHQRFAKTHIFSDGVEY